MKKLMLAVAMVCAAAIVQAASVTWGFGGKVYVSDDGSSSVLSTAYTGTVSDSAYLALVYLGQNVSSIDIASITADNVVDQMAYSIKTSGTASAKGKWNPATQTTDLAGYNNGASFGIVFFDGEEFTMINSVDTSTGAVGDGINNAITYADLGDTASLDNFYATGASGTVAGAITTIPEPTSALMLLVGLAGLALKRKVA